MGGLMSAGVSLPSGGKTGGAYSTPLRFHASSLFSLLRFGLCRLPFKPEAHLYGEFLSPSAPPLSLSRAYKEYRTNDGRDISQIYKCIVIQVHGQF